MCYFNFKFQMVISEWGSRATCSFTMKCLGIFVTWFAAKPTIIKDMPYPVSRNVSRDWYPGTIRDSRLWIPKLLNVDKYYVRDLWIIQATICYQKENYKEGTKMVHMSCWQIATRVAAKIFGIPVIYPVVPLGATIPSLKTFFALQFYLDI